MQLAAYCLLVSDIYKQRPPHGIIRYKDREFKVPFTTELENQLLDIMDTMRIDVNSSNVKRSHNHAGRCRACSYRSTCDEALL